MPSARGRPAGQPGAHWPSVSCDGLHASVSPPTSVPRLAHRQSVYIHCAPSESAQVSIPGGARALSSPLWNCDLIALLSPRPVPASHPGGWRCGASPDPSAGSRQPPGSIVVKITGRQCPGLRWHTGSQFPVLKHAPSQLVESQYPLRLTGPQYPFAGSNDPAGPSESLMLRTSDESSHSHPAECMAVARPQ
jgi:hypothetical protein